MTEAESLVKSNTRPSLPVSIPIHVYRKTLKNICISKKTANMNANKMSTEKQAKQQCETIRQINVTDMIINLISERPAKKRPNPENLAPERVVPERSALEKAAPGRPAPERPVIEKQTHERPAPERLVLGKPEPKKSLPERPAPERAAPERAAPERAAPESAAHERAAPERPAPERSSPERPSAQPAPERSEREEFGRIPGIRIQCCDHVCSRPDQNSLCTALSVILGAIANFLHDKMRVFSEKSTQTDNTITIDDIDDTLQGSNPVLRDITTFSNQFKQFFAQLGTMCQVLFSVKIKDNKEVFVFSRKKRQKFLRIIKNVIETICCDDTDVQPPSNIVAIDVDELEFVDITVSEHETENTGPPASSVVAPSEVDRQDNQQNERQEESVNNIGLAANDNIGAIPRDMVAAEEQPVTIPIVQEDLHEQEIREPIMMEETVNQNMSTNNEMNIDQTTFNPQIMDNTRRFCNTPRTQALQQQQYYQNQNYRNYHNKMFRHPNRGNGRPSLYPSQRPPMRNTERPQAVNTAQSQSPQIFYPYSQAQLQQQYALQQYYQRNSDIRPNDFSNPNPY